MGAQIFASADRVRDDRAGRLCWWEIHHGKGPPRDLGLASESRGRPKATRRASDAPPENPTRDGGESFHLGTDGPADSTSRPPSPEVQLLIKRKRAAPRLEPGGRKPGTALSNAKGRRRAAEEFTQDGANRSYCLRPKKRRAASPREGEITHCWRRSQH